MRKVIGIGETIVDVLFRDHQPVAAVPGGSSFNALISLSRMQVPTLFVSEVGADRVGELVRDYMRDNGLSSDYLEVNPDAKTAISLAFLNDRQDAEYVFYKEASIAKLDQFFPKIEADDIVLFGSYYALNPAIRSRMFDFLQMASDRGALIYYDVNFRQTHQHEALKLGPSLIENFEFADIIRGSDEDFKHLFQLQDVDKIYKDRIRYYTPTFIYTKANQGVELCSQKVRKHYEAHTIQPVSTIGAGDNFNSGILYGLLKMRIRKADLLEMTESDWDRVIQCGLEFASEVCLSYENSVPKDFAQRLNTQF